MLTRATAAARWRPPARHPRPHGRTDPTAAWSFWLRRCPRPPALQAQPPLARYGSRGRAGVSRHQQKGSPGVQSHRWGFRGRRSPSLHGLRSHSQSLPFGTADAASAADSCVCNVFTRFSSLRSLNCASTSRRWAARRCASAARRLSRSYRSCDRNIAAAEWDCRTFAISRPAAKQVATSKTHGTNRAALFIPLPGVGRGGRRNPWVEGRDAANADFVDLLSPLCSNGSARGR